MTVHGEVAAGFEPVRDAFAEVLGGEGGMGFSVVRRGEPLVDLWGGVADASTGRPWLRDTPVVLFSGTKGITATVFALLVARGDLRPDDLVARWWPEFSRAGKENVTVGEVFAHQAGLPYVEEHVDGLDSARCAAALASQRPLWTPGSRVAYHALTYGYLADELFRRATGKDTATLAAELIAEPHEIELWLRAPQRVEPRLAVLASERDYRISTYLTDPERRAIVNRMYRMLNDQPDLVNQRRYRQAGLAAASGVSSAGQMAKLYGMLADPAAALVPGPVLREATRTWSEGLDAVNDRPQHFGLGYELADPIGTYGPVARAFGHSGAGGGRHGAWPEQELGFSFTINEMCSEDTDHRAEKLLAALFDCVR